MVGGAIVARSPGEYHEMYLGEDQHTGTAEIVLESGSLSGGHVVLGFANVSKALIIGGIWSIKGTLWIGADYGGSLEILSGKLDATTIDMGSGALIEGQQRSLLINGGVITTVGIFANGVEDFIQGSTIEFEGGMLQAKEDNPNFIKGFGSGRVILNPKGGTIHTDRFEIGISSGIAGSGGLTVVGSGALMLGGTNTYSGTTFVRSGTFGQKEPNALSANSDVHVSSGAVLDIRGFHGTIGGLSGEAGAVVTNSGLQNSTLVVGMNNSSGTFIGTISDGNGGDSQIFLEKRGTGILTLSGSNSYTGVTIIHSGGVLVNGYLASPSIMIQPHGILGGTGILQGNILNSGWVSPAHDQIGTLNVRGNYMQDSGGSLLIQIAENNSHDKLKIDGKAELLGALQVEVWDGFVPPANLKLTILEAAEGVHGIFEYFSQGALQFKIDYTDNEVHLILSDPTFSGTTPTRNSVGKALNEAIVNGQAEGPLGEIVWILGSLPREKLGPGLDELTPKLALNFKEILFNAANIQYGQIVERLGAIRAGARGIALNGFSQEPMVQQMGAHEATYGKNQTVLVENAEASPWNIFANASGVFSKIVHAADLPRLYSTTGYFSAGGDCSLSQATNVGVYFGYQGITSWYSDGSRFKGNGVKFGLYGTGHWNGFYANAIVGGGYHSFGLNRSLNFGMKNWVARSHPSAGELNSLLGTGYELRIGDWRFGMNMSLQYTYLGISSFTETGAGNLSVKGSGQNPSSLISTLGGVISYLWEVFPGYKIIPIVGLAWQHEFLNYGQSIAGSFDNGTISAFQLTSVGSQRNNALGTTGLLIQLGHRLSSYFYYNPQFGGNVVSHGVLVGINYSF